MAETSKSIVQIVIAFLLGALLTLVISYALVGSRLSIVETKIEDQNTTNMTFVSADNRLSERLNNLIEQNTAVINQNTNIIQLYIGKINK